MKKLIPLVLVLVVVLAWLVWGQGETYTIHINVPAGTMDEFVYIEDFIYSDEDIVVGITVENVKVRIE